MASVYLSALSVLSWNVSPLPSDIVYGFIERAFPLCVCLTGAVNPAGAAPQRHYNSETKMIVACFSFSLAMHGGFYCN